MHMQCNEALTSPTVYHASPRILNKTKGSRSTSFRNRISKRPALRSFLSAKSVHFPDSMPPPDPLKIREDPWPAEMFAFRYRTREWILRLGMWAAIIEPLYLQPGVLWRVCCQVGSDAHGHKHAYRCLDLLGAWNTHPPPHSQQELDRLPSSWGQYIECRIDQ
ncbi:hypothetical protein BDV96DRAFT_562832 [Lophiotrema nucula]|uniref:Uncharacterized protein n=1 Tax=Lophiotrema nucula TaxID=690887 RepID=A0A6A5ZSR8_9PLEO|nr:hypothetical protein BDV96DRAFT_562832 [Lophiotrema nucula]